MRIKGEPDIKQVEAELNNLAERRSRELAAENARLREEAAWKENARRYFAKHQKAFRSEWIAHHRRLERVHTSLAKQHRQAAERLS